MNEKIKILKNLFGSYYKSKNEYLFFCPFCNHHKKKLSVNVERDVYKCWVCDSKGKSVKKLVNRFASQEISNKWAELEGSIDMSKTNNFFDIKKEVKVSAIDLPSEYICLANRDLPLSARTALKYLKGRGLTRREIIYYKIGYCESGEFRNRIIVPSFGEEGECNYFVARTFKNDWLTYKNPDASKNIIFNDLLIDWNNAVTLVEGAFDTFKADNAVPLLGSSLNQNSKLFRKIVKHKPDIYMALDADAHEKSLNITNLLLKYDVKVWEIDTTSIEDIGAVTSEKFADLKKKSTSVDSHNILLHKIARI